MTQSGNSLYVEDWGLVAYSEAFERQQRMVEKRLSGRRRDTLVLTEHPPTITLGRRGSGNDLRFAEAEYVGRGIALQRVNRGGLATAHEPGQLVAYPILLLKTQDLRLYIQNFLQSVVALLEDYGLRGQVMDQSPGVWVNNRKICSFGIALKKWTTSHGIALNVNNRLVAFDTIVPCGVDTEQMTSIGQELGTSVDMHEVKSRFVNHFCTIFDFQQTSN